LEWIAESTPIGYKAGANVKVESSMMGDLNNDVNLSAGSRSSSPARIVDFHAADVELADRMNLVRKLKQGRTALMLSGGGAQAMYRLGTIKALCESNM